MCGRFAQFSPKDILKSQFNVEEITCDVVPSYNIVPSHRVLAIIHREKLRLGTLTWGLVPAWMYSKEKKAGLINARAETFAEKPAFRKAAAHRRCLIPADGYYEWARNGDEKIPYYIYLPSRTPMGFAGLWESYRDEEGNRHSTCAIVTRGAKGRLSEIHARMPVILDDVGRELWLDSSLTDKERLVGISAQYSVTDLSFHRVSDQVNRASFNERKCIDRI